MPLKIVNRRLCLTQFAGEVKHFYVHIFLKD